MAKREVNPTFFIGLGGIGNKVLRHISERFSDTNVSGTLPPTVLLRSIDTTSQATTWGANLLEDSQFTNLGGFDADEVVSHLDSYPEVKRWYTYSGQDFSPGFITSGAKSKRPVGRICFFQRFHMIKAALEKDFAIPTSHSLREKLSREHEIDVTMTPRVYLVGSVAGGTCSGMFIDVAFAIRYLLEKHGYRGIEIVGMLALPSVIHADSRDGDTDVGTQRRLNAVGALQEMDFLMNSWKRKDFELQYPQIGRFYPTAPLFNQVFLIGGTKEDGVRFGSGKEIMIRQAHFLFSLASASIGGDVADLLVNVPEKIDPSQRKMGDGQIGIYCTFGSEWLEIPMDQVLANYAANSGRELAKLLTDVSNLPSDKDIQKDFQGRIPQYFSGIARALELLRKPKESMISTRGLEDLAGVLQNIQTARKKNEVNDSLNDFLGAIPGAMANLRKSLTIQNDFPMEDKWLNGLESDWIHNPDIGIAGVAKYFSQATLLLGKLNVELHPPQRDQSEILDQCGGGLLKKCDPTPAYEYALERLAHEVKSTVRGELGELANRLIVNMNTLGGHLSSLTETIRLQVADLTIISNTQEAIPQEMWKVDPSDLTVTISGNSETLLQEIANLTQTRIIEDILNDESRWELWTQEEVEAVINNRAVGAIRYAISKKIMPPANLVSRLKQRMTACYPMADTEPVDSHLFRQFFGTDEAGPPTSIKIVSSATDGPTHKKLTEWADQEVVRANSSSAFQTVQSNDPTRDDLINISLGWPLWLLREIRTDWEKVDGIRKTKPGRYNYSLIMNEIPGAATHSFRPMDPEKMKELFSIALAMQHIKSYGAMEGLMFDPDAFGHKSDNVVARESHLHLYNDAFRRFEQTGLGKSYGTYLQNRTSVKTDVIALQKELKTGLSDRRELLEAAKDQIQPELFNLLTDYYNRAEAYARTLVVL